MKNFTLSFVLLIVCVPLFAQESKPSIENLGWLSGCWESAGKDANNFVLEQWMKPAGQMMLGMSRTVRRGKASAFEYLRIVQDDTGLYYIAKPSQNNEETLFKLVKSNDNEFIFENAQHDFPQRIIYRLESNDSLKARIEGINQGKFLGIDFPMRKAKCD